ncbi:hypothetical protein TEA_025779 [Camellia sinensis var. sinensis]|uniref:Methyltransferase n=1 Tax=Camellia sinensis var. sinensis TaxID=542762 RepID=A0A4S4E5C3_CAMSN|nr:hypothetical protein TEA_025779 [Camellia sinensis var. sinensis]
MRGGPLVPAISISSSSSIVGCINTLRRQHCSPPLGFHTSKYWDKFYKRHQNKFFKDRHYLVKDWGQYFYGDNTVSPYGKVILESHVDFNVDQVNAFVCDVANDDLCDKMMPSSIDVVTLPNGYILLRDYAIGDYAQVELRKRNQMISENFYIRGDGTCAFYFSEEYLSTLFMSAGFSIVDMDTYSRQIQNRSRNITMSRVDGDVFDFVASMIFSTASMTSES